MIHEHSEIFNTAKHKKIENRQKFFRPIKSHISFTQNISFKSNISMNVYSKLGLKRFDV